MANNKIENDNKFHQKFKGDTDDKVEVYTGEYKYQKEYKTVGDLMLSDNITLAKHLINLYTEVQILQGDVAIIKAENDKLRKVINNLLKLGGD